MVQERRRVRNFKINRPKNQRDAGHILLRGWKKEQLKKKHGIFEIEAETSGAFQVI